ncbi:LOW QUALITY PROTEIN: C-C chemokine receptor type 10 [Carettochelys insculpta]|uniref:LOW QUALITY PROTEIN: C-C chemokine receptor type 10 n=1 Tax=Carettochelys insculpta TaxID=44489 RepID=UPI003EBDC682
MLQGSPFHLLHPPGHAPNSTKRGPRVREAPALFSLTPLLRGCLLSRTPGLPPAPRVPSCMQVPRGQVLDSQRSSQYQVGHVVKPQAATGSGSGHSGALKEQDPGCSFAMTEMSPSNQTPGPWAAETLVTTNFYSGDELEPEAGSSLPELCEKGPVRGFARAYQPAAYLLLSLLGVAGNGLVLLTHARYRRARSVTDVCLLHLAVADLLLLLTLPFAVAGTLQGWLLGTHACRSLQGFYALNFYSGFLFLTCISVDRYMAIVRAPAACRLRPRARCYGWLAAGLAWLLSTLLALPQFVYAQAEWRQGHQLCRVLFPAGVSKAAQGATNLAQVLLGFVLPFLVMTCCYAAVARALLAARSFQRHKALRVTVALVLVFVALQLPHSLVVLLDTADMLGSRQMSCAQSSRKDLALVVTGGLAFARCCLNPVLYAFVGVRFRRELRQLASDAGCVGWAQNGQCPRSRASFSTCRETV